MPRAIRNGDCVRTPDGRIGRVLSKVAGKYKVRVHRKTSNTHQFLMFSATELKPMDCPKCWMSPEAYNRYLRVTLAKLRKRLGAKTNI